MAFQDPIAAYTAADPYQATLLCQALNTAEIEAHVIDDESQAGIWLGGLVPELNKTQIWIDRSDSERARIVFEDFERRAAELNEARTVADVGLPPIDVTCDSCGQLNQFGAHLRGSVQQCETCDAYLDVGEIADTGEWAIAESPVDADTNNPENRV